MLRWWRRTSLRTHLLIQLCLSLSLILATFLYVSVQSLNASTGDALRERLVLARVLADRMDSQLNHASIMMESVAHDPAINLDDGDLEPEKKLLVSAYEHTGLFKSIHLLDASGIDLVRVPLRDGPVGANFFEPPYNVVVSPDARSPVWTSTEGRNNWSGIDIVVPILGRNGGTAGYLMGWLDLADPRARTLLYPYEPGARGSVDLVDKKGRVLASSRRGRVGQNTDHGGYFASLLLDGQATAGTCHSCHEELQGNPESDVLAFAPIKQVSWGVVLRQPESEVFSATRSLAYRLAILALVVLIVFLCLLWLTTRSIVLPLRSLMSACRRIAGGDLSCPIQAVGVSETVDLASSLEEMRRELKSYTEQLESSRQELERRVEVRTAELERAHKSRGELLQQAITAQEEERRRIARELHDETCQSLTGLMLSLDAVGMAMAVSPQDARVRMASARQMAGDILQNVRRLIADLRPSPLDDLGLVSALVWYGEQRLKPVGIDVDVEAHGLEGRLPSPVETALFRIAQEAMSNVAKHSDARTVSVTLNRVDGHVNLTVEDDGKGFTPPTPDLPAVDGHGLGLRGMNERAATLGGNFVLESAPGRGTHLSVDLPIHEEVSYG